MTTVGYGDIFPVTGQILLYYYTLQRHCTEKSEQIFPDMKLRGLVPNAYIHVSLSDLYVYSHDQSGNFAAAKQVDLPWECINCTQIHECGNWERDGAVHFWEHINRIFFAVQVAVESRWCFIFNF
jgi:hypothetical protein